MTPLVDLKSKVAFVTGGASGIGLGMVRAFLAEGMKVVAADVRQDHLDEARETLGAGGDAHFIRLDVTDRPGMAAAAQEAVDVFGKVHVLCNNAGVGIMASAKETTYDDWDWSLSVNLTGVFNGIRTFLPHLLAHGEGGHIVNTASVGAVLPSNILYGAAKAGVMGMSEALRAELEADNIGVTCLLPGPVASNIHEVAALRPKQYAQTNLHEFERRLAEREVSPNWMAPLDVGEMVVDAIQRNLMFVFTHNEHRAGAARRFEAILDAFPRGEVPDDAAARLGFRIANPMYETYLARKQEPALPRRLRTQDK